MSMLNEKRAEELLALTIKTIQAPSYSGQENLVVGVMRKFCDEHKFTDIHIDGCGNCICHIRGSKSGPELLFDDHMDTVLVPDKIKWEHDPLGTEIVSGRVYGYGISDMKGVLSAVLAAVLYYAENVNYGFPGDIYVVGAVHEECFEDAAVKEISAYVKPDYVITGEASQLDMKTGQRGRTEIVVETFGVPAHPASPHKGMNAAYKMRKTIEEISKLIPSHHDVLSDGILKLVGAKSSPHPGASVVPDYCRVTYDRRLLTGETRESVLASLQELLDHMMKEDPQLKAKTSYAVGQEKCRTGETIEVECFFPG